MSLLNKQTLFFDRDLGEGYHQGGVWVEGKKQRLRVPCTIQPYKGFGLQGQSMPQGYTSKKAVLVYAKQEVRTYKVHGEEMADSATINGETYLAFDSNEWSLLGSRTAHHEVIFIRKDPETNGTL